MNNLVLAFGGHDFDLVLSDNDLARDDGLASAVIVSLFCDARARSEQLPPGDETDDLRGWWGDLDLTRGTARCCGHCCARNRPIRCWPMPVPTRRQRWSGWSRIAAPKPSPWTRGMPRRRPRVGGGHHGGSRVGYRFDVQWGARALRREDADRLSVRAQWLAAPGRSAFIRMRTCLWPRSMTATSTSPSRPGTTHR